MANIFKNYTPFSDDDGVDPLLDPTMNAVISISEYSIIEITQQEQGRPEMLSFKYYGTVDYFRELMAYNGISDVRDIKVGTSFKIPDRTMMISAMSKAMYTPVNKSTVRI